MPTTRPGLNFNQEGICSACLWSENKKLIDWHTREQELLQIANWAKEQAFKKNSPTNYDCVLGVSGGKDSTWQALYLKNKLGLNPLLVQFVSSDGTKLGKQNIENLARHGFGLHSVQPNPKIAKLLSKRSFLEFGNVHKYAEMALFAIPFKTAIALDIPLVFFGENPALEAGDSNTDQTKLWDATTIVNNNTLGGHKSSIWLNSNQDNKVIEKDLILYTFPEIQELKSWGGMGIFMGYYLNWSGYNNGIFAIKNGMNTHQASYYDIGVHYKHNSLDSDYGGIVNSMLKQTKLGFGNTTELACYDIRDNRITREQAALLAMYLDGRCHPRYIQQYCDWIGISTNLFYQTKEKFRANCWEYNNKHKQYQLINPIWEQYNLNPDDLNNKTELDLILKNLNTNKYAYAE